MYYAVAKGRKPGIYYSWDDCNDQVYRYSGARYKKFETEREAKKYIKKFAAKSYHVSLTASDAEFTVKVKHDGKETVNRELVDINCIDNINDKTFVISIIALAVALENIPSGSIVNVKSYDPVLTDLFNNRYSINFWANYMYLLTETNEDVEECISWLFDVFMNSRYNFTFM